MWHSKVKMDLRFYGDDNPLENCELVTTLIVSDANTHNKKR